MNRVIVRLCAAVLLSLVLPAGASAAEATAGAARRSSPQAASSAMTRCMPGTLARFTGCQGRLRPNRSCASTHSSATMAEPSESSPHSTVAATISVNLRTLSLP